MVTLYGIAGMVIGIAIMIPIATRYHGLIEKYVFPIFDYTLGWYVRLWENKH
jgi:hypothetical protein